MDAHSAAAVAVVPIKAMDRAKGRLAAGLAPEARRELVAWMLGRVLAACHEAESVGRVVVVAGDEDGVALARSAGAEVMRQWDQGLGPALDLADEALRACAATLVVAADLPLATGADLDAVCRAVPAGPAIVVAPTDDGGTAALYRRPPGIMATAYGPDSARRHLELARAAGVPAVRLDLARLALDVDTPEQLAVLRRSGFPVTTPGA